MRFFYERQANAFERCLYHEAQVIDDQWTCYGYREFFFALLELPSVKASGAMSEIDAPCFKRSRGILGLGFDLK